MINLERLGDYELVAVDVETTGLHWYRDKMFGVAVAAYADGQYYSQYWDIRNSPRVLEVLKSNLRKSKRLVNHSIKFDVHFLMNEGIPLPMDRIECTMVRAALINEHEPSFGLDELCQKYLGIGKVDIYADLARLFGGEPTREAQIKNLHRAPESLAGKYAVEDPVLALKLWQWQEKEIEKQDLGRIWELERKLTPVLIKIERQGVRTDDRQAETSMVKVNSKIYEAQLNLNKIAGRDMNANSPKQMRELFGVRKHANPDSPRGFEYLTDAGVLLPVTDAGEASLGKDTLITMAELGDKRAEYALSLRKLTKARSFLKDHILGHSINGRVYPNYNQMRGDKDFGTRTGRFSINDPALQQIPARDVDMAEIVRSCFIPEDGHVWCSADWAQFEFRWFAHYTNDPHILKAYEDDPDTDYHQIVSDLTGIPRKPRFAGDANAKQINLGLVFGMGKGKMAYEMGLDYTMRYSDEREWFIAGPKAQEVFDTYHGAIPGVSKILSEASSIASSRGFVKTIMGRHLRFPGRKATHKAGGLVFQGSSADCMKQKMIEIEPMCEEDGALMLLSVHDELDFSMPEDTAHKLAEKYKKVFETFDGVQCPIKCRVPIRSTVELGPNWFIASK